MITRVELKWENTSGQSFAHTALLVDRSFGGAGIATTAPVPAGTHIIIKERNRMLAGTVRYCRPEGREFLLGIQYDEKDPAWSRHSANPTPISTP